MAETTRLTNRPVRPKSAVSATNARRLKPTGFQSSKPTTQPKRNSQGPNARQNSPYLSPLYQQQVKRASNFGSPGISILPKAKDSGILIEEDDDKVTPTNPPMKNAIITSPSVYTPRPRQAKLVRPIMFLQHLQLVWGIHANEIDSVPDLETELATRFNYYQASLANDDIQKCGGGGGNNINNNNNKKQHLQVKFCSLQPVVYTYDPESSLDDEPYHHTKDILPPLNSLPVVVKPSLTMVVDTTKETTMTEFLKPTISKIRIRRLSSSPPKLMRWRKNPCQIAPAEQQSISELTINLPKPISGSNSNNKSVSVWHRLVKVTQNMMTSLVNKRSI